MRRALRFSVLTVCLAFCLTGCSAAIGASASQSGPQRYEATWMDVFDTVTTVVGYAGSEEEFEARAQEFHDEMVEYHQLYDIYNDYEGVSNIKTINDNAGVAPVEVDERIIDLLVFARDMCEATDGKTNAAMGSVTKLWHDARAAAESDANLEGTPPSEDEIADRASVELANIRRHLRGATERVKERLNAMIRSAAYQKYLQDPIITVRNDRYVLPVKAEYRSSVPGLVPVATANYAMERLEPNTAASQTALDAWNERGERVYLIANEKYTSQLYLSGMFNSVTVLPEAPGYAAGQDLVVDETHAVQYFQLPGTGSRNGADYTVTVENGVEYLRIGDYLCVDYAAAPGLWAGEGAYTTIQTDGLARWYQVGELAGQTLTVTLPAYGGFTVYDQNGQPVASSWVWGDTTVTLPENGWIVFAGDPGSRFYLTSQTA